MPRIKQILMVFWVALALTALGFYLACPSWFTAEAVRGALVASEGPILLIYLLASLFRGILFIPSTPFILAGAMLFPDSHFTVFLISMAGIIAGGSYVYFFTEYLEVEKVFKKRFKERFEKVKRGMDRYGIWIVILWAFFPVVPTDLISYTAGVTRMPYWKFLLGITLGEIPLVAFYVYTGNALGTWLLG